MVSCVEKSMQRITKSKSLEEDSTPTLDSTPALESTPALVRGTVSPVSTDSLSHIEEEPRMRPVVELKQKKIAEKIPCLAKVREPFGIDTQGERESSRIMKEKSLMKTRELLQSPQEKSVTPKGFALLRARMQGQRSPQSPQSPQSKVDRLEIGSEKILQVPRNVQDDSYVHTAGQEEAPRNRNESPEDEIDAMQNFRPASPRTFTPREAPSRLGVASKLEAAFEKCNLCLKNIAKESMDTHKRECKMRTVICEVNHPHLGLGLGTRF